MLDSLYSAVSGLQQYQTGMDVIGNNIANANTVGFKSARTDYEDTFSNLLAAGGTSTMQVGTGVNTAAISNRFTQGSLSSTGLNSDLGISGDGFFMVQNPGTTQQFATRAGNFKLDQNGYLVTTDGYRLQGFSDAGLTTRGDVQIDSTGKPASSDPAASVVNYGIGNDGKITVWLSDGTSFVRGQVLLQKFTTPQALMKEGSNLYSGILAAGPLGGGTPQSAAPGTSGLGNVQAGALEMSNVDLTTEFASLIVTQRAFQANARVLTTSDEVLQELVNLKR